MSPPVVVLGGGITGLTAAYRLASAGAEVALLERSDRLGGCIETGTMLGRPVEHGPDMFLGRVPWARELCTDLGLDDDLVNPATSAAHVWWQGRPHELPTDLVLGAPSKVMPLLRTGLLSTGGALRAGLDLVRPRQRLGDDPAVGDLVRSRFGDQVCERLVDPLVGGINAGSADGLSAAATAPQLHSAAEDSRSLLVGLRRQRSRAATTASGPVFWSLRDGLGALVDRLADEVRRSGVRIHLGDEATMLNPAGAGTLVQCETGDVLASHVVAALPARSTAKLIGSTAPAAADALRRVRSASVAMVILAVDPASLHRPPGGSGLLFPRVGEDRLVTAVSFGSNKWPSWAGPDHVVLRASVGRFGHTRGLELDDDELVRSVEAELAETIGLEGSPLAARVVRWIDAFPQYEPGHAARVADARRALREELPGVELAGASYEGLGIPACIRQGGEAAGRVLASMAERQS
ncbi:MAG: protoporphyrinogen oxidase [Actinomycetota bacterium]